MTDDARAWLARWLGALGLLSVFFRLAYAEPEAGAILGAPIVVGALVGPRLRLRVAGQRALTVIFVAAVVFLIARTPQNLNLVPALLLLCSVGAGLRATFARPDGGRLATFALGVAMLVGVGLLDLRRFLMPWVYPSSVVAFVVLSLGAMVAEAPRAKLDVRRAALGVALFVAAGALFATGATGVPFVQASLQRQFYTLLQGATPTMTGYSHDTELGSMLGALQSEEVALRVYGAPQEYLRGHVYDAYDRGRWGPRLEATQRLPSRARSSTAVILEGTHPERFVPFGACGVGSATDGLERDRFGAIVERSARWSSKPLAAWWFDPTCTTPSAADDGPRRSDVAPPSSRAAAMQLADIASAWTEGEGTPRGRAEAIERHLRAKYRYSLGRRAAPAGADPVIDFLTVEPTGHCEYFASSMALLARAAGIPARVVTGYRGSDFNPIGGWWVVRERNAHMWVELWIDGTWRTFDPTPPTEEMGARQSFAGALRDLVARTWQHATRGQLVAMWVGLTLAAAYVVWRRVRRAGARAPGEALASAAWTPPPPSFERLSEVLARRGHTRPSSEPLESFAARLARAHAKDELAPDAADLLLRYARLRYGDEGTVDAFAREVDSFVARCEVNA